MRVAPVPREESTQTGAQDLKPSEEGLEFQTQGRRRGPAGCRNGVSREGWRVGDVRREVGHARLGSFMRRLSSCRFCEVTVSLSSRPCCWYRK